MLPVSHIICRRGDFARIIVPDGVKIDSTAPKGQKQGKTPELDVSGVFAWRARRDSNPRPFGS